MKTQESAPFQGTQPCPCKRKGCPRYGDCAACYEHHHLPGKKLPTTCERIRAKEAASHPVSPPRDATIKKAETPL